MSTPSEYVRLQTERAKAKRARDEALGALWAELEVNPIDDPDERQAFVDSKMETHWAAVEAAETAYREYQKASAAEIDAAVSRFWKHPVAPRTEAQVPTVEEIT